jgi:palmitoyltransferase ZDHHC9/14/18
VVASTIPKKKNVYSSYLTQLLLLNVTTIEQIRNSAHKSLEPTEPALPNPFSHGTWRRNVVAVLCRPAGYSWLDSRGVVVDDKRGVNPGMMVVNVESQAMGQ